MKNKTIAHRAKQSTLKKLAQNSRLVNHSAVAILVNRVPASAILMVQRATRKGDPWSGDMAFPGGRREHQDEDHIHTARRELEEEIGLNLTTEPLDSLATLWTKSHSTLRPMAVHQFIFAAPPTRSVSAPKSNDPAASNPAAKALTLSHEIADAVWVPLSVFNPANRQYFTWKMRLGSIRMPCFYYQHYKIWGLSLRMIENFQNKPLFHSH